MDEEFARDGVLKEREGRVRGSSRAILNCGHQCLGPRNEDDPAMEQKASEVVSESRGVQKEKDGAGVDMDGGQLSQKYTTNEIQVGEREDKLRTALNLEIESRLQSKIALDIQIIN